MKIWVPRLYSSPIVDDEPAAVLSEVEALFAAIAADDARFFLWRTKPTIAREIEFGGRRVARVYARWSLEIEDNTPCVGQGAPSSP